MKALALFSVLVLAKLLGAWPHLVAGSLLADLLADPLAAAMTAAMTLVAFLWQDALIALGYWGLELVLRPRWMAWGVYGTIVLYSAVNVVLVRVLGTPFTWSMAAAADTALMDSVLHYLTLPHLLVIGAVLAWSGVAPRILRPERSNPAWMATWMATLLLLVLVGPAAARAAETHGLHRSALVTLGSSALPRVARRSSELSFRVSPCRDLTVVDQAAEQQAAEEQATEDPPAEDLRDLRGQLADHDVLLVILESAAAGYLQPWGGDADPMPHLSRLARGGLLFENAYAVYPESIKGLLAPLASRHPAMDTPTEDYGAVSMPTLPAVLRDAGYATSLFHSGRFEYLGMQSVVRNRGFDLLADAGQITGEFYSSFGAEERDTVTRSLEWVAALPDEQRFFLTYMPIAGHHPYDSPEPGPFPRDSEFGAYQNALHYGDRALGELLAGLAAAGRQRTLVVVVGDHGQAFQQHPGNFGHTFFIYEENVHVPLVLSAPGLGGRRLHKVASHVDVAPTILALLGMAAPPDFEGASLLDPEPRMALLFTDYSLPLLGLRDGRWKFIHELESGRSRLFDLQQDPGEQHNLAAAHGERVARYRSHLTRWSADTRARMP